MFSPQTNSTIQKTILHIPSIKRLAHTTDSLSSIQQNASLFIPPNYFQPLQIQLHHSNSQLGLRTFNSRFTKVSSTDDDFAQSFKHQNTRIAVVQENPQISVSNVQVLIKFMEKSELTQQNEQKEFVMSTKNILRNICNAQNQYILFNQSASEMIQLHTSEPVKFKQWVNRLRFHTFEQFQEVWLCKRRLVFRKLYKKLCRKFYLQNAIPYIINSRIKNKETKKAHIRYLYRFVEGIEKPQQFFYFKQKDKEKEEKQEQKRVKR